MTTKKRKPKQRKARTWKGYLLCERGHPDGYIYCSDAYATLCKNNARYPGGPDEIVKVTITEVIKGRGRGK